MIIFTGYLILIASALLYFFPAVMFNDSEPNISGAELARVKRKYNTMMTAVFIPVIIAVFVISWQQEWLGEKFFLLIGPCVSSISFFEGLFALKTDVYHLPVVDNLVYYWHSTDPKKDRVAMWQMELAVAFSVISLILYFI